MTGVAARAAAGAGAASRRSVTGGATTYRDRPDAGRLDRGDCESSRDWLSSVIVADLIHEQIVAE